MKFQPKSSRIYLNTIQNVSRLSFRGAKMAIFPSVKRALEPDAKRTNRGCPTSPHNGSTLLVSVCRSQSLFFSRSRIDKQTDCQRARIPFPHFAAAEHDDASHAAAPEQARRAGRGSGEQQRVPRARRTHSAHARRPRRVPHVLRRDGHALVRRRTQAADVDVEYGCPKFPLAAPVRVVAPLARVGAATAADDELPRAAKVRNMHVHM